jgi:hypothetical protein
MSSRSSFLREDDRKSFERPGRVIPRLVAKISSYDRTLSSGKFSRLTDVVTGQLTELSRLEDKRFRCCCVSVVTDDGMSWSAEAVSAVIADKFPQYKCWSMDDQPETRALPAISKIVGENTLFKLSAKAGLTRDTWPLGPWKGFLISVFLVLISGTTKVIEVLSKASESSESNGVTAILGNMWVLGGAVTTATLSLFAHWVKRKKESDPKSTTNRKLTDSLRNNKRTIEFQSLRNELALQLKRVAYPKVIIVDDYEALDDTTKEVLTKYLETCGDSGGAELWVVFEGKDGNRLSSWVLDNKTDPVARSQFLLFEQVLLTYQEKRELTKVLGNDDDRAAEFTTVKAVCHDKARKGASFQDLFLEWRKKHPARTAGEDSLKFLYLLSLTATPGNLFLRPEFLRSELLADEDGFRENILTKFFGGTHLGDDELHHLGTALFQEFPRAVLSKEAYTSVRVMPEAAIVLDEQADALRLPPKALGHLFWCFFWWQFGKTSGVEAFWMRKIVYHLKHARVGVIKNDEVLLNATREQLLEVSLFAIDGSLEACLFSEIVPLLRHGVRLVRDSQQVVQKADLLLQKVWECYAILGEPEIDKWSAATGEVAEPMTTALLDAHAMRMAAPNVAADAVSEGPLLDVFLDSLSTLELQHAGFRTEAIRWLESSHGQSVHDYAKARSAWLAFTVCPMLVHTEGLQLEDAIEESTSTLDELESRLFARLETPRVGSSQTTDLITLSLSIWCQGLLVSFREKAAKWSHALEHLNQRDEETSARAFLDYLHALIAGTTEEGRNQQLIQLAQTAVRAVRIADELRRHPLPLASNNDLFSRALAREICAVALGSILTACHYLHTRHAHKASDDAVQVVSEAFRSVEGSLSYSFPPIRNWEDLSSRKLSDRVDDLLKLCILVWDTFELTQLRDILSLRRAHFVAVCREMKPHDSTAFRDLMESASAAVERGDFMGLVGNCIFADCLEPAADLAAHYVCKAAHVALKGNFGAKLKQGFALVATEKAHALDFDVTPFLTVLLEREKDGESFLARQFRNCPEGQFCGLALHFLNATMRTLDVDLGAAVVEIIDDAARLLPTESVQIEAHSLLEVYRLRNELRKGNTVDLDERLQRWANRKEIWLYAWLLEMLIEQGHNSDEVREEAKTLLKRDPDDDEYNSYYLLALAVAKTTPGFASEEEGERSAARYLQTAVHRWESSSPAEINSLVYMILCRLYPEERGTYLSQAAKWQGVHLHREHLRRLPEMAKRGEFFLIFQDHFRWMEFWGLRTELPPEELSARINVTPERRLQLAKEWKARGAIVPEPIAKLHEQSVISAEFLITGSLLFREPVSLDTSYSDVRLNFSESARVNLQRLLTLVVSLPNLPQSIRELLLSHSERLYNFSLPPVPMLRRSIDVGSGTMPALLP